MRRRGFLQCIAISGLAVVMPWRPAAGWQVVGAATLPGALLEVTLKRQAPPGATWAVEVCHTAVGRPLRRTQHGNEAAETGRSRTLATPYPYADLVPGDYAVAVVLCAADGRELDRAECGSYSVRRVRFSA